MIRWMLWGRTYGKTRQTIKWFMEDPKNRVIITMDEQEAERIRRQVRKDYSSVTYNFKDDAAWLLKEHIVSVSSWMRLKDGYRATRYAGLEVAVDNLELVLPQILHADVRLITATGVNDLPDHRVPSDPDYDRDYSWGSTSVWDDYGF